MINSNAIDNFYEKQHKLVLTSIDIRKTVMDLLSDIGFMYPELYNTTTVSKLNDLCETFHKQVFSTDGEVDNE